MASESKTKSKKTTTESTKPTTTRTTTTKTTTSKGPIFGICAVIIAIVVIVIAVVVANNNTLNDSYFVSDGTKYVINLTAEELGDSGEEHAPIKAHIVYNYSDDTITGVKTYYEYQNDADAKSAHDYVKSNDTENASNIVLDGKFIIITSTEDEYKNLKASDIKQQIELIETYRKNSNNNTTDDSNSNSNSDTTNN